MRAREDSAIWEEKESKVRFPLDSVTRANIATYATDWSAVEYAGHANLWPNERTLIQAYFPPSPAAILDLGCGAGRTTSALANLGYKVIGIDLAERLLTVARERHPSLDFRLMDARRLDFESGSFDAALFSFNGIDCIFPEGERVACLCEVARILKPRGIFMFSSHNLLGTLLWRERSLLRFFRLLLGQRGNRHLFQWYARYMDGGGEQLLFSAPPARTIRQLHRARFEIVATRGLDGGSGRLRLRFAEHHVDFVARKMLDRE